MLRSPSKISTIPEEGNEDDLLEDIPNNNREECCTPPDNSQYQPLLARAVQVPNRIRRLRTRHLQTPKNLWFTGIVLQLVLLNARVSNI